MILSIIALPKASVQKVGITRIFEVWNKLSRSSPKIYPKFLLGLDIIPMPGAGDLFFWIPILIIQVDWHPRLIPYDIPNSEL